MYTCYDNLRYETQIYTCKVRVYMLRVMTFHEILRELSVIYPK